MSTNDIVTGRGDRPTGLDAAVLNFARDLISEDGSNTEYDRAIVELTAALLGISTDERDRVARLIRRPTRTTEAGQ